MDCVYSELVSKVRVGIFFQYSSHFEVCLKECKTPTDLPNPTLVLKSFMMCFIFFIFPNQYQFRLGRVGSDAVIKIIQRGKQRSTRWTQMTEFQWAVKTLPCLYQWKRRFVLFGRCHLSLNCRRQVRTTVMVKGGRFPFHAFVAKSMAAVKRNKRHQFKSRAGTPHFSPDTPHQGILLIRSCDTLLVMAKTKVTRDLTDSNVQTPSGRITCALEVAQKVARTC